MAKKNLHIVGHLDNPLSPCKAAVGVAFPRPMKDFIAQVCQT